jgi:AraC-like DNA-binding protein
MAAEVRMSATNLHRLFKQANDGVTPMAFLNERRLERAGEMLADSNCFLQIQEIGYHVGLTNNSYFTKDFKTKFGRPHQFRNVIRKFISPRRRNDTNDSFPFNDVIDNK